MIGGDKLNAAWDTTRAHRTCLGHLVCPRCSSNANDEAWTPVAHVPSRGERNYALHMKYPDFGPVRLECRQRHGLKSAAARILRTNTAEVEWFTEDEISMDGIQTADFATSTPSTKAAIPFLPRARMTDYVYHTEGDVPTAVSIDNPSSVRIRRVPVRANVHRHDLSTDPTAIVGTNASVTSVEWDGERHDPDARVGPRGRRVEGWTGHVVDGR